MFKSFFKIKRLIKSRHKSNYVIGGLACGIIIYVSMSINRESNLPIGPSLPEKRDSIRQPDQNLERMTIIQGQITKNLTLSEIFSSFGLSHEVTYQVVKASKPIYNLRKLKVGNRFELEMDINGNLTIFRYHLDSDNFLEVLHGDKGYEALLQPFDYAKIEHPVFGTIKSSLFLAINRLGEKDQLALDMAEIFSWDIDFNTEIQAGDYFRLIVEKLSLEGKFVKYGRILAAEFYNDGKNFKAYFFEDPEGEQGYYNASGYSLKRDFLKSPVKFSRISSRFSHRRFHPILKRVRPHLGVDYAAPRGTPVVAAGKGRIRFRGWKGGFGKYIVIKHSNGFTTRYGHLSRFRSGLSRGSRVVQGQTIGYVGSTGLSTGPHLDYRVTRDGVFVNPVSLKMKPTKPLKSRYRSIFEIEKIKRKNQLKAIKFPNEFLRQANKLSTYDAEFIY